jgi:hypothetical protein
MAARCDGCDAAQEEARRGGGSSSAVGAGELRYAAGGAPPQGGRRLRREGSSPGSAAGGVAQMARQIAMDLRVRFHSSLFVVRLSWFFVFVHFMFDVLNGSINVS